LQKKNKLDCISKFTNKIPTNKTRRIYGTQCMIPIRIALHLPIEVYMAVMNEKIPVNPELFEPMKEGMIGDRIETFMQELIEMARTLQYARQLKE